MAALPSATAISTTGFAPVVEDSPVPPISGAMVGSNTSTTIANRSSTISQPIAMWPWTVSCSPRSSSARSTTTVLAMDTASPRTSPPPGSHPSAAPSHMPRATETTVWTIAPGMAMERTARRSRNEKWMPTPNISRITPSSASSVAIAASAISPGVNGPITTPARM